MRRLCGAVFDCDGLLADTETPDFEAWGALYAERGLTLGLAEWAQGIGVAKGHDARDWHAPLAASWGPGYDRAATQARRHALYMASVATLGPMPGVAALLDALADDGVLCAVASNSDRAWVEHVLAVTGLAGRFAAVATADEVACPKPAPDVYLLAARRLGLPPGDCAAFEDSPRGLEAALGAGMWAVAVPTGLTRHLSFGRAHRLVGTLEELTPDVLRRGMEGGGT